MKKVTKKTVKKPIDDHALAVGEIKRHMSALSEEFQGRVSGVAEQFSGLNDKFDGLNNKVDEGFKKIDGQFRVVHHTLGAMKEDMDIMKGDVSLIKADLRKRVTYEELESLTKRVTLLEKKAHK